MDKCTEDGAGFSIEEGLLKIEELVSRMEQGTLALEEALQCYEEGMKLIHSCSAQIERVEKRIQVLEEKEEIL